KVVLSTNIAETSITIEGITAVIDSGLSKLNWYNPRSFTSSLVEAPVSKASANQRRGRAGRTCEGTCYRLYSRKDFENRPLFTTEEIFRTDLSEVILRMADLGISDFEDFDFISTPGKEGLIAGMETLNLLGALNPDRSLSTVGKMMTEFPLAPRQSRIIVEAILAHPEVLRETIVAAAFLSTQSPYVLPPGEETDARKAHHRFRDDRGDFISYLKLFRAFTGAADGQKFCEDNFLDFRGMAEIANVAVQLEEIAGSLGIPLLGGGDVDDYLCCVGRGMIQFVCVREGPETPERGRPDDGRGRKNASYRSLTADKITIHPGSVMFRMHPRYIVAGEIVRTGRTYAMSVSPLSAEVLRRIAPDFLARESGGQEGLFGSGRKKPGTLKKAGDFTDSITIAGEIFQVTGVGGKRTAVLPWEKLEALRDGLSAGSGKGLPKGLKGRIVFGNLLLLDGEKLGLILRLAPFLDPENALSRGWPRKRDFAVPEELEEILPFLDGIARPVPWKKGSRELGFLGLCATGDGGYRFRCSRGFHSALAESLASLEALIGESGEDLGPEAKDVLNQNYRRLSNLVLRD
ncbi:MAG: ATP-dependent RNA helicase, partial [Treponema sp.]|nr:ATP-dependent RNA helicase [Treponema sp.]